MLTGFIWGAAAVGATYLGLDFIQDPKMFIKKMKGLDIEKEILEAEAKAALDRNKNYNILFQNIGIVKEANGDWIRCVEHKVYKNYKLTKFKMSDTLSTSAFIRKQEEIEDKLLSEYDKENRAGKLEIYYSNNAMYFKILNENIDLVQYKLYKTKKHLIPLGTDLDGNVVYWNLKKDPHIKIIGTTGCGKSCQQLIILNHIYNNMPGAPIWAMDFKNGIEFGRFKDTKNLVAYAEDLEDAPQVLASFMDEYEKRMKIIKDAGFRSFDDYIDSKPNSKMQRGFLCIDEFADLMDLNTKDTKDKEGFDAIKYLIQIARKVRAAGLHVMLGTQRPTADSIPSSMKNNVTATVGMHTENELNSRLIIDTKGCETLQQSQALCRLESKLTFMTSYYIPDSVIDDTVCRYQKPKPVPTEVPTEKPVTKTDENKGKLKALKPLKSVIKK